MPHPIDHEALKEDTVPHAPVSYMVFLLLHIGDRLFSLMGWYLDLEHPPSAFEKFFHAGGVTLLVFLLAAHTFAARLLSLRVTVVLTVVWLTFAGFSYFYFSGAEPSPNTISLFVLYSALFSMGLLPKRRKSKGLSWSRS